MRAIDRCTVLIAAPERLPALRAMAGPDPSGEVLEFTDADALKALEVITNRHPSRVCVDGTFARTPRGATLVTRIKADPTLEQSAVEVLAPEEAAEPSGADSATGAHQPGAATAQHTARSGDEPAAEARSIEAASGAPVLDQWGTRRAARYAINGRVEVAVDGKQTQLVNLSTVGAQVVSTTVLKPNQRVRVALIDAHGVIRFGATVAWASFEIDPGQGPRYRAGLDFIDADAAAVDAYGVRHRRT